jgi:hypothetical protein
MRILEIELPATITSIDPAPSGGVRTRLREAAKRHCL